MIRKIKIRDFGPLERVDWSGLCGINLIIGNNSTGKTFLLKALYTAIKSVEETGHGHSAKRIEDILSDCFKELEA